MVSLNLCIHTLQKMTFNHVQSDYLNMYREIMFKQKLNGEAKRKFYSIANLNCNLTENT